MSDEWCTVIGLVADSVGAVVHLTEEVSRSVDRAGREHVSVTRYRELEHAPASKYATCQPSEIPIRWRHRDEIGRCVLLERRDGCLSCVAVLPGPVSFFTDGMPELFWSSGTRAGDGGELKLTEISLTPSPATVALPPVKFYDGLPEEARGLSGAGAPWGILTKATEVMRGVYDPMETRCWFDDRDAPPRRPVGESRGTVMRNGEPMEMFYRPATITAVY